VSQSFLRLCNKCFRPVEDDNGLLVQILTPRPERIAGRMFCCSRCVSRFYRDPVRYSNVMNGYLERLRAMRLKRWPFITAKIAQKRFKAMG